MLFCFLCREFAKLPEKLLHSESVEKFFSDGSENNFREKQVTSKNDQNTSNLDKKGNTNTISQRTNVVRLNEKANNEKQAISTKSISSKGMNSSRTKQVVVCNEHLHSKSDMHIE